MYINKEIYVAESQREEKMLKTIAFVKFIYCKKILPINFLI